MGGLLNSSSVGELIVLIIALIVKDIADVIVRIASKGTYPPLQETSPPLNPIIAPPVNSAVESKL